MASSCVLSSLALSIALPCLVTASPYSSLSARAMGLIAPNLPISQPSSPLTLTFTPTPGSNLVTGAGQLVNTSYTEQQPQVSGFNLPGPGPYAILMVDSSVDVDATATLLHWFETDVYTNQQSGNSVQFLQSLQNRTAAPAPYLTPTPITCVQPHDYSVMLFRQPSNFTIPQQYRSFMKPPPSTSDSGGSFCNSLSQIGRSSGTSGSNSRQQFHVIDFIAQTGLGQPVAATWFQESVFGSCGSQAANAFLSAMKCPSNSTTSGGTGSNNYTSSAPSPITTDWKPYTNSGGNNDNATTTSAAPRFTGAATSNKFDGSPSVGGLAVFGLAGLALNLLF